MGKVKKYYHFVFGIIFIAEIICASFQFKNIEYFVKPTILTWIILTFIQFASNKHLVFYWAILGFVFSMAGDVLLMFSHKNELFFLTGIGGFLLAHIFYIIAFSKVSGNRISSIKRNLIYHIPIIIGVLSLYLLLMSHLDLILKIAVFIYAIAITIMVMTALNRKKKVSESSFKWVLAGAILFILSDSLLSIDKFWISIPMNGLLIMSTYMLAQYFIMLGLIKQTIEKKVA